MVAVGQVLAGIVLATCALMLIRMSLGSVRRYRLDAFLRRLGRPFRDAARRTRKRAVDVWQSVFLRRARERAAAREAAEVIERARRRQSEREGNVYTPRSFRRPKKPH
jgi:hypothetical protein